MKLEAYLKERGMRSSHLAKACGVPASTISRLLSGAISNPSLELLERIAIATDGAVTPNDFLPFRAEGFGAAGGAETAQV